MTFIWKYIDLDPAEVDRVKKIYFAGLPRNIHQYQSLDLGIDEFMGMKIFKSVLIQVAKHSKLPIHSDFRPHDNNKLAINIPLLNCEDSVTYFYKTNIENDLVEYSSSGSPLIRYDEKDCEKIDEFRFTNPVIFRTDIPHSVVNNLGVTRLGISLRFENDPWHLI